MLCSEAGNKEIRRQRGDESWSGGLVIGIIKISLFIIWGVLSALSLCGKLSELIRGIRDVVLCPLY